MNKNKMQEIAIAQLDGIESLLLSIPAIHGLRQQNPSANITLFISTSCVELRPFIPHIDECYIITNEQLPAELQRKSFDLVVNLSYCDSGIYFSGLLSCAQFWGPHLDTNNNTLFDNPWEKYFESTVGKSELNPFHRSDIYKKIARVFEKNCEMQLIINQENLSAAQEKLANEDHLKIGLSLEKLNVEDIANFIEKISSELPLTKIYLLGGLKNKSTAKSCIDTLGELKTYCIDLTGRLSLAETVGMSAVLDIVISADPVLCQLSSGFGTLSIELDNNEKPNFDSCAYNDGHLLIREKNGGRYSEILSQILVFLAQNTSGSIPTKDNWKNFGADLFHKHAEKHSFYYIQRSQETTLVPLLYTGADAEECLRSIYKLLWMQELEDKHEVIYGLDILHNTTLSKLTKLLKPLEQLYELAAFGQKYCAFIKRGLISKNVEHAKDYTGKLQDVDDLIDCMANCHQDLIPIINYFEVSMSQIRSTEPVAVAVETTKNYLTLQNHVLILLELIQSIFKKIQKLESETTFREAQDGRPQN